MLDLTEEKARKFFEEFRSSIVSLRKFGHRVGYHGDGLAKAFRRFFPDEYDMLTEERSARRDLKYRKGRSFEYLVRDALRAKGWWVLRSPQSRSPIDLVAIRRGSVAFIQCKAGGLLTLIEKAALIELADSVGAVPILADREPAKSRGMRLRRIVVAGYLPWESGSVAP